VIEKVHADDSPAHKKSMCDSREMSSGSAPADSQTLEDLFMDLSDNSRNDVSHESANYTHRSDSVTSEGDLTLGSDFGNDSVQQRIPLNASAAAPTKENLDLSSQGDTADAPREGNKSASGTPRESDTGEDENAPSNDDLSRALHSPSGGLPVTQQNEGSVQSVELEQVIDGDVDPGNPQLSDRDPRSDRLHSDAASIHTSDQTEPSLEVTDPDQTSLPVTDVRDDQHPTPDPEQPVAAAGLPSPESHEQDRRAPAANDERKGAELIRGAEEAVATSGLDGPTGAVDEQHEREEVPPELVRTDIDATATSDPDGAVRDHPDGLESPLITEVHHPVQPPSEPRRSRRAFAYYGNYSDEDMKRLFDRFQRRKRPPNPCDIPPLRQWISEQLKLAVEESRYAYGEKLCAADERLERLLADDGTDGVKEKKRREAADRCTIVKKKMDEVSAQWAYRIQKWRDAHDARMQDLDRTHKKERDDFAVQWEAPAFSLQFNKMSARLLSLRMAEKNTAIAKQFQSAMNLKAEADRLEKAEAEMAHQRAIATMKTEFRNLEAKQKREMEGVLQHAQRIVELMERERDAELRPMQQITQRLTQLASAPVVRDHRREDEKSSGRGRPVRMNCCGPRVQQFGLMLPEIKVRRHVQLHKEAKDPIRKRKAQESF
jgi:hypothetical protein